MANIEFEQNTITPFQSIERSVRGIPALIIKTGIVKTEERANLVMIGVILVCILFMGYKTVHFFKGPNTTSTLDIKTIDQSQFITR
ncbi:MAG: hypothetical protein JWL80_602 [Parcubacteria group bacterium]|nr:hypothetical protein [Parcubacteria group bacterium]